MPPIEAQRTFSKLYDFREELQRLQVEANAELTAFIPALLAKVFRGKV